MNINKTAGRPKKDNIVFFRRVTKEEFKKLDKYLKEIRESAINFVCNKFERKR